MCLLAIEDTTKPDSRIQLNPGPNYIMKKNDICYYLSVTKEEFAQIDSSAFERKSTLEEKCKFFFSSLLILLFYY